MKVYRCLQPFMVCYSPAGTTKLIDRLCEDHDIEVKFWGDLLKESLCVRLIYCHRILL